MIHLLSAGAVKPGLVKVIEESRRRFGYNFRTSFATAPAIRQRLMDGEEVDIVIAPPAVLDALDTAGRLRGDRVTLGRIGVGVLVRDGVSLPPIATVDDFTQALLASDAIVYNQASTGSYLEALFERMGIAARLATKTTRCPDFAAVLGHIRDRNDRAIGLGATTVIIENARRGVKFAGPLPKEIQNYTIYAAALTNESADKGSVQDVFSFLSSPVAKSLFEAAGIE